jgi:hypothetical protein
MAEDSDGTNWRKDRKYYLAYDEKLLFCFIIAKGKYIYTQIN